MSDRQYQTIAGPLTTATPDETTVGWQRQLPAPVRRIATIALCMVAVTAPVLVPLQKDEPQTQDRWQPRYPDRISRTVLPRAAHLVTAQNIDPIVNVVFDMGGGSIPTRSTALWQYLGLTGPLDVPSTEPLRLQWLPTYPDRVPAAVRLLPASQRSYQADRFDAPAAVTAPDSAWDAILPDRPQYPIVQTYRAQAFAMDTQWLTPPIEVQFIGWRTKYPDQHPPRRGLAPYIWAEPHFVVEVDVPVMSWTGWYLDPPVRRVSPRALIGPRVLAPIYLADVTATAPDLGWQGHRPEQIHPLRRSVAALHARSVVPPFVADVTDTAPTLSARAIYPDRIAAKVSLRVSAQRAWVMDATFAAPVPPTVPDLAAPVYPVRVYGRTRPTHHPDSVTPAYVLDVTVPAPSMSWQPEYPDRYLWALRVAQQQVFIADTTMFVTTFKPIWVLVDDDYLGPWDQEPT